MKLPPFALERFLARHEFSAQHLLCCSDCESMNVRDLLAREPEAAETFLDLRLGYTESRGSPALRQEIARLYGSMSPENVLVCTGAEEAIYLFMQATLEAGDHIVVHSPCYLSLSDVARAIGCEVSPWVAHEEDGWALDTGELQRLLGPRTKAIVVNSPHNPTGFHLREKTLREIVGLAEERGIALFSDEVYRGLEQNPADRLPPHASWGSGRSRWG